MDEENEQSIKIVDRRRFTESGETRKDAPPKADPPKEVRTEPPVEATERPTEGVEYGSFIVSLAAQAMMLLGEAPGPEGMTPPLDLDGARQMIDILGMLQEKTQGNLNDEEARLHSEILASLRMAYVKKSKEKA